MDLFVALSFFLPFEMHVYLWEEGGGTTGSSCRSLTEDPHNGRDRFLLSSLPLGNFTQCPDGPDPSLATPHLPFSGTSSFPLTSRLETTVMPLLW